MEREGIREGSPRRWRTGKRNRSGFGGRVIKKLENNKAKIKQNYHFLILYYIATEKLPIRKNVNPKREK